jgi:DNA adenine methylase
MDSPLKWPGGKHYLAKKIISYFPPHLHYVEPYGGSLAVLLEKNPSNCSEVVNDIDFELMNFWRVLQDKRTFEDFQRKVQAIPFSEFSWNQAMMRESPFDKAVAFFVRCRQSRTGSCKDFATLTKNRLRRGMNEQASAWLTCVEKLPEVYARLIRVVVLDQDALSVIQKQDGPNTLFYLDPPYYPDTRLPKLYRHEMTTDDHHQMIGLLTTVQGKFILSGYRNPLYDLMAKKRGWNRVDIEIPNHLSGGLSKELMVESLWMNFNPKEKSV